MGSRLQRRAQQQADVDVDAVLADADARDAAAGQVGRDLAEGPAVQARDALDRQRSPGREALSSVERCSIRCS